MNFNRYGRTTVELSKTKLGTFLFLNSALEYGFKYGFENVLLFEKKGGADFFPGLYGGLYGQNLPYTFKKSYGDF